LKTSNKDSFLTFGKTKEAAGTTPVRGRRAGGLFAWELLKKLFLFEAFEKARQPEFCAAKSLM